MIKHFNLEIEKIIRDEELGNEIDDARNHINQVVSVRKEVITKTTVSHTKAREIVKSCNINLKEHQYLVKQIQSIRTEVITKATTSDTKARKIVESCNSYYKEQLTKNISDSAEMLKNLRQIPISASEDFASFHEIIRKLGIKIANDSIYELDIEEMRVQRDHLIIHLKSTTAPDLVKEVSAKILENDIGLKQSALETLSTKTSYSGILKHLKKISSRISAEDPIFQLVAKNSNSRAAREILKRTVFETILPFSHNRVLLSGDSGDLNESNSKLFMNASYMKYSGDPGKRLYIATQNPNSDTVESFWTMVCEQNVAVIISLISEQSSYVPTDGAIKYGASNVKFIESIKEDNFTIATYKVDVPKACPVPREVKVFKYVGWPQGGVPKSNQLKKFIETLHSTSEYVPNRPAIVHCSGGSGRTGTFIAIDIVYSMLLNDKNLGNAFKFEGHVKILEMLVKVAHELRTQRVFSIHTEKQIEYMVLFFKMFWKANFIPKSIKDIEPSDFLSILNKLSTNRLLVDPILPKGIVNKKNRYKDVLPYSSNRVILEGDGSKKPLVDPKGYINASFLSYSLAPRLKYIATQEPKSNTVDDFWKMVWQQKVQYIVSLLQNVDVTFWPTSANKQVTFDDLIVEFISEDITNFKQNLKIYKKSDNTKHRTVHYYHFQQWPDKKIPKILDLNNFLKAWRTATTDMNPVVVHCSAGVGRTGSFIAIEILHSIITKDKNLCQPSPKELVYKVAIELRNQRHGVIQTIDQLNFIIQYATELCTNKS